MSAKIEQSEHLNFINNAILEGVLSLSEIEKALAKKGFRVSKATLSTYGNKLKEINEINGSIDYDKEIQEIIDNKSFDYKAKYKERKRLLYDMYETALNNAYKITKSNSKNSKMLPLPLYKSIREIQSLLKGQQELIKDEQTFVKPIE
jgi:hypothetical protein